MIFAYLWGHPIYSKAFVLCVFFLLGGIFLTNQYSRSKNLVCETGIFPAYSCWRSIKLTNKWEPHNSERSKSRYFSAHSAVVGARGHGDASSLLKTFSYTVAEAQALNQNFANDRQWESIWNWKSL